MAEAQDTPTIRTNLQPGDIGNIVRLHGTTYAREYGFDHTFEAYVAGPLAEFVLSAPDRGCLWIAEQGQQLVGCIGIVPVGPQVAQLRWFLVAPNARGAGLGTKLLGDAIAFCKEKGYTGIFLWTVSALTTAAGLYRAAGFEKVEEHPRRLWGVDVDDEKYELAMS